MLIFLRLLVLFSITITQSETECKLSDKGNRLDCSYITQEPNSDWSFKYKTQFHWIGIDYLYIVGNRIKSFASGEFTKFTNAISISVNQNELSAIDFNEFGDNSKLTTLFADNNQISEIKPIKESTVISITDLSMENNVLTDITELCKITKLRELKLSKNRRLDYSNVKFNCWSELTSLHLAETNLKRLNHNYRALTGCNKLNYVNLEENNLEILCFQKFPTLPKMKHFNIRNNNLTYLDVLELRRKFPMLLVITITGSYWSCDYYERTLALQLKENNITEHRYGKFVIKGNCLDGAVMPEMRYCPKIEREVVPFWIIIIVRCVSFVTVIAVETLQVVFLVISFKA